MARRYLLPPRFRRSCKKQLTKPQDGYESNHNGSDHYGLGSTHNSGGVQQVPLASIINGHSSKSHSNHRFLVFIGLLCRIVVTIDDALFIEVSLHRSSSGPEGKYPEIPRSVQMRMAATSEGEQGE